MTSTDDTYNGWTNRETWAVALYIDNDQGWQEQVFEALTTARDADPAEWNDSTVSSLTAYRAGQVIKSNVEGLLNPAEYRAEFGEQQPEALAIVLHDIGSLYRVNWDELGANFLTDLADQ